MECPNCKLLNREGAVFCLECGAELGIKCPNCEKSLPPRAKFCDGCGQELRAHQKPESEIPKPAATEETPPSKPIESERKHVTALFADLSGYTAMSERLDPEEVKEITAKIFDEVSKIISKYEGFVEKFAGDAVMALFGATEAHEDDPVRAIKAAREIHNLVNSISPQYEERIEQPLVMHSGINTGLVVTGDIDLEKGTHGVAGDTLNVAARLSALGNAGDILVGPDTFYQAEGYFDFKALEPTPVKGKSALMRIYRVVAQKEQPIKLHRLHGFQAELIGRKVEMGQLTDAARKLKKGSGAVFSIYGPAGTGKSRLIQEFKASLNLEEFQWLEGHAYPHSQNIPYFPLIDLLNRSLRIEEGDPPNRVKEKIEKGISSLVGENTNFIPYIGSLYSISYPEIDEVSPAFWKEQLQKAIQRILSALAQQVPTIIRLEDLHWADPSFLEMIRLLLSDSRDPILFLCAYRPSISLFTGHQISAMTHPYHEIRLQDLSTSESQGMVESLLKTEVIPSELQRFLQDKVEGNPFYIEEVINSLIESEALIRDNGSWKLTRQITEAEISSTIHGVISSRLDRLEKESKRILQEASVIGRTFFYEILNRVTQLKQQIDQSLRSLERLDLIRARALQPDLEYIFKHALTQEVVYNGLLKKERQAIHERIGLVMEQLFKDRLPEFYETLAYHFQQGRSVIKAVDYLIKSGEKSLRRYAVDESNQYYQEAYNLLKGQSEKTSEEQRLLIDVLIKWSLVFYYRGDFRSATKLLTAHERLAESIDDKNKLGMFYGWSGMTMWARERFRESEQYLNKALEIGEKASDKEVIGYACTWQTWTYAELGMHEEAQIAGKRAQEIAKSLASDDYLFLKSLSGIGYSFWLQGEGQKCIEAGRRLVDFGLKRSSIRSQVMGHYIKGLGYFSKGDLQTAIDCFLRATQVSGDPYYFHIPRLLLGMSYILTGRLQEAETIMREIVDYSNKFDTESIGTPAQAMLGGTLLLKGEFKSGLKMLEDAQQLFLKNERKFSYIMSEYVLGTFYLQIALGNNALSLPVKIKNIGFLIKHIPLSSKKAETHFKEAIETAKKIGAKGLLAQSYHGLGLLHTAKKRTDQAKECLSKAIELFEQCEAEVYLQQAIEALASLD
ncbi:MAG: AAA family ATPase [Deltaproteobacteria bacterium]|jgi:class 3 adenylate cyclase/tetratricopeptide (TPR) repeat protein